MLLALDFVPRGIITVQRVFRAFAPLPVLLDVHTTMSTATRVFLRRNGSSEPGCMAKLPPTWAELLAVADTKLFRQPGSGAAKRIFAVSGDEILDDDYDLIGAPRMHRTACDARPPLTRVGC